MIKVVKRYECNACKKVETCGPEEILEGWSPDTEVGDLCPSCARSWESYKKSFIDKMRIDNGAELVKD
jgi:hypothetical protein